MPVATVVFAGWIDIGESFVFAAEFFRLYLFAIYNLVMPDFLRCSFCYVCPQQLKLTLSLLLPLFDAHKQQQRNPNPSHFNSAEHFRRLDFLLRCERDYVTVQRPTPIPRVRDIIRFLVASITSTFHGMRNTVPAGNLLAHFTSPTLPKGHSVACDIGYIRNPACPFGCLFGSLPHWPCLFYLQGLHRSQFPGDWNNSGDMFSWLCSAWFYPLAGA
jgi:hypothetical protein